VNDVIDAVLQTALISEITCNFRVEIGEWMEILSILQVQAGWISTGENARILLACNQVHQDGVARSPS
jgi:hypothetical protein